MIIYLTCEVATCMEAPTVKLLIMVSLMSFVRLPKPATWDKHQCQFHSTRIRRYLLRITSVIKFRFKLLLSPIRASGFNLPTKQRHWTWQRPNLNSTFHYLPRWWSEWCQHWWWYWSPAHLQKHQISQGHDSERSKNSYHHMKLKF